MLNFYPSIRPALFAVDAEIAHALTLNALKIAQKSGLGKLIQPSNLNKPVTVMGLTLQNPLGLAAGLDKNGDYIDALAMLGFGFIEIGTVTPRAQTGNPKPRLFRLPEEQAIINRMGFNNLGIDHLLAQVEKRTSKGILGINIGKNADTPLENAVEDYLLGLRKSYRHADYVTLNISSPNTKNLRQLQQGDAMKTLLASLKEEQQRLAQHYAHYVPLVVKIAPDLSFEEVAHIAELLLEYQIDGVIATNTTLEREKIQHHPLAGETGGLSGAPLTAKSTEVVRQLAQLLDKKIPIIAAGGILNRQDAEEKLAAGASLLQIYSGLIYRGPILIEEILAIFNA